METSLIVGLGNPSPTYDGTRHNIGRQIVAAWKEVRETKTADVHALSVPDFKGKLFSTLVGPEKVIIAMDLGTYMNDSGPAVQQLVNFFKLLLGNLLLVHDDIAFPLGSYKLQFDASSANHNGVASVINALGTQSFARLRIGIESRADTMQPTMHDFVLQKFSPEQKELLQREVVPHAVEAIDDFLVLSLARAMTKHNRTT